jgi:predicted metal-binding protein
VRCEDGRAGDGAALFKRVKKLRKQRGLKEHFALEDSGCLGACGAGCVVQFEGKKRSTYLRAQVHAEREAEAVVEAALAYAALEPGGELPERRLPGQAGD